MLESRVKYRLERMQKEVVSSLLHYLLLLWLSDAIKDAVKIGLTKDPLSVQTSAFPFNPETQLKLH